MTIANKKIGLVLDGGGGKGAYHIGVFKALKELDISKNINAVSGTSVGALNACLFPIYNINSKITENIWLNETEDKIFTFFQINKKIIGNAVNMIFSDFLDYNFLLRFGVFSRDGLIEIMDKYLCEDIIKSINIYACCTDADDFDAHYFKLNNYSFKTIKKILLASSAIPVLFPPENIKGSLYIDGGIADNSPIKALKNEGCSDIIIVHLKQNSNIYKNKIYKGINIYELYPKKDLGDFFEGTLNFSKDFIKRIMHQGYTDTLNALKKYRIL